MCVFVLLGLAVRAWRGGRAAATAEGGSVGVGCGLQQIRWSHRYGVLRDGAELTHG